MRHTPEPSGPDEEREPSVLTSQRCLVNNNSIHLFNCWQGDSQVMAKRLLYIENESDQSENEASDQDTEPRTRKLSNKKK